MTKPAPSFDLPSAFPSMAAFSNSALEGLTRSGAAYVQACLAWQQEIARFTTARLQCDGELCQKLLATRNWSDAIKLQQDWAAAMGQDYVDEANRLAQLAQKAGSEVMQPVGAEAPLSHTKVRQAG